MVAAPVSYQVDGEQYVSVNVGWGGAFALVFGEYVQNDSLPNVIRILTFKLGGSAKLPKVDWQRPRPFVTVSTDASSETLTEGYRLYQELCMGCHGLNAVSGKLIPDLRRSPMISNQGAFAAVVLKGALSNRGMPNFQPYLNETQAEAIRAYLIQQAERGRKLQAGE